MSILPKGKQWLAHDRAGKRAARRRLRQRIAQGIAVCESCETERPLTDMRPFKVDPDGALLLTDSFDLGTGVRIVCTPCVEAMHADPELAGSPEALETRRAHDGMRRTVNAARPSTGSPPT